MLRIHNGKWEESDTINPISSDDQHLRIMADKSYPASVLGLDTEMLILDDKKIVWPWTVGYPQERDLNNPKTSDLDGNFDFHGDGYITELCVKPTHCLDQMMFSVGSAFSWRTRNPKTDTKEALELSAPAVYDIPAEIEAQAPDQAKRLGCMPSTNVYGDAGNPSSLPSNKRTTGCHLHISNPVLKDEDVCTSLVKWADILVGCTWTYISPNSSKSEAERRKAYGRAGEYRLKKYDVWPKTDLTQKYEVGVEYRVLPGTPIHHPAYLTLMFSLYRSALRLAAKYGDPQESLSLQAKDAINNADKPEAKKVIRSLPISDNGRKLIRYLRRVPIQSKKLMEWALGGVRQQGHQTLFVQAGLVNRSLTI